MSTVYVVMLPSTGHFKELNCPFYDSGLCERPYCHFRHVKRDLNAPTEGIEHGAILQQLVSEAVKKVLQQTDSAAVASPSATNSSVKLTYNPTPIAQLKKIQESENIDDLQNRPRRHIPVPYTPHRPATAPVKRVVDEDTGKPFIYNPPTNTYSPGSGEGKKPDPYFPQGGTSNGKYEPGSEALLQTYEPLTTSSIVSKGEIQNYVPSGLSDKAPSKKKLIEYEPTRASVNAGMSKFMHKTIQNETLSESKQNHQKEGSSGLTYQPTPLHKVPCFSSDEDEPPSKKKKTEDLNGVNLDLEFEMLGEILDDEENTDINKESKSNKEKNKVSKEFEKSEKTSQEKSKIHDISKMKDSEKSNDKETSNKSRDKESIKSSSSSRKSDKNKEKSREKDRRSSKEHDKSSEKKEHKSSKDREKNHNDKLKSGSSSSSKSHKSSSKDKERCKSNITNDKKHSSSKSSSSSSKSSSIKSSNSLTKKHSDSSKDSHSHKRGSSKSENHRKETNSRQEKNKSKSAIERPKSEKFNSDSDIESFSDGTNLDELIEELSDPDEDTIAMECMKIFEEYVPTSKPIQNDDKETKQELEEYIPGKKRISHTSDKNVKIMERPPVKKDYKVSAAQRMAERISKVKEYHALKNISTNAKLDEILPPKLELKNAPVALKSEPVSTGTPNTSKVRIAHVPNAMLYSKKPAGSAQQSGDNSQPSTSTTVQTIPKGATRTAHVPNDKFCDRPGVLEPLASKIPANLRSTFLNKMIDECIKIYLTPSDAYARAQQEELTTSKKCNTIPIYKNSAMLTVNRLRKELQDCRGVKKTSYEIETNKMSHSQVLLGKLAQTSWSIEKTKKSADFSDELKGLKFYKNISQWILDEEQLQQNGFPRPHPDGEKGKAKIYTSNDRQIPPKGRLRTCCRCKKEYAVDKKGFPVVKEDCSYHPNRKYRYRGEVKYQCCSQDESSEGCSLAPTHVYEYVDYENLKGYVRTMPKDAWDPDNHDYGVYALDCEMCYTTQGLDLTRITVIDSSCKTVYETLIKPFHPIIDYNTRYSGITEEQMEDVTTTLIEVQATLLSMFSSRTILVGHSLESDFKALKLIHDTVIDTSVLFPHKMGPPYKRALRNLSSEHLKKIIQNSVDGHDSAEDATVCMELILWKLKEELKTR